MLALLMNLMTSGILIRCTSRGFDTRSAVSHVIVDCACLGLLVAVVRCYSEIVRTRLDSGITLMVACIYNGMSPPQLL